MMSRELFLTLLAIGLPIIMALILGRWGSAIIQRWATAAVLGLAGLMALTLFITGKELDCIEISDPDSIDNAEGTGLPVILKLDLTKIRTVQELEKILDKLNDRVQFFLLDGLPGTEIINTDILNLAAQYRIMIGFEINRKSIHSWIDGTDIFGISLKGGTEIKPGFKDYDELADILEEIELD